MPFTPSHVMAVLPLMRARRVLHLDAVALAIGAMAPDFEYFLNGRLRGTFAHSIAGIALFCVPLTLVLAAVWQLRVGPMLAAVAQRDLVEPAGFWRSPGATASAMISAAIGAATHLVWDSLTHWGGYFVHTYPILQESYPVPVMGPLPLHRILQHLSSVVGLVVVIVAAVVAIRRRPRDCLPPRPSRGRTILAGCVAGGVAIGLARLAIFNHYALWAPDSFVVAVISGGLLGCLVAGAVVKVRA